MLVSVPAPIALLRDDTSSLGLGSMAGTAVDLRRRVRVRVDHGTTLMKVAIAQDIDNVLDARRWFAVMSDTCLAESVDIEPWKLPQPYRFLLVHEGSMTERLEQHFGGRLTLRVCSAFASGNEYARWIFLFDLTGRCVEMGGVYLDVGQFSMALRSEILEGEQPLGRLLSRHGVVSESVPRSFFELDPTRRMADLLQMEETRLVFGRRTDFRVGGHVTGEIFEVLPCYDIQRSPRNVRALR